MRGRSYNIGVKAEARLMGAIFDRPIKDADLRSEVNGVPLRDALMQVVDEIPDFVSRRHKVPLRIGSRDLVLTHYGFTDGRMRFLQDVAEQSGLSKQTVANYHGRLLQALRSPAVRDRLRPYLKKGVAH